MENQRSQDEILEAEQEFFDRLWYIRHMEILEEYKYKAPQKVAELDLVPTHEDRNRRRRPLRRAS